jgi:hypothetical protein
MEVFLNENSLESFYILIFANILILLQILSFLVFVIASARDSSLCQRIVRLSEVFSFVNFILTTLLSVICSILLFTVIKKIFRFLKKQGYLDVHYLQRLLS